MIKLILLTTLFLMPGWVRADSVDEARERSQDFNSAATALNKISRECNADPTRPLDKDCVNGNFKAVKSALARELVGNPDLKKRLDKLGQKISSCFFDYNCIVAAADPLSDGLSALQAKAQEDLQKLGTADPAARMAQADIELARLKDKLAQQKNDTNRLNSDLAQCKAATAKVNTSRQATPASAAVPGSPPPEFFHFPEAGRPAVGVDSLPTRQIQVQGNDYFRGPAAK